MNITVSKISRGIFQLLVGGGFAAMAAIAYTIWHDSKEDAVAYGETKALLASTTEKLKESKAEIEKLVSEKKDIQQQADSFRQDLLAEQVDNKYNKRLLDESINKTKAQDTQLGQLVQIIKAGDPCAPIREEIKKIEDLLQQPSYDAFAPKEEQREQAKLNLEKKYRTLNTCLGSRK